MRTMVTGATGLIGFHLASRLEGIVALSRNPEAARQRLLLARPGAAIAEPGAVRSGSWAGGAAPGVPPEVHAWDPESGPPSAEALRGVDAVIHLAGEPLAEGRWTAEKKRRIRDSRVAATRHLVAGLAARAERPSVFVSASAVGYYGDRADEVLDEGSVPGKGFLAEICSDWEREAMAAQELGVRVVTVRLGLVLAPNGGALARMRRPFEMGIGGPFGSGGQWMPWIHVEDAVGIVLHAMRSDSVRGPMNAVAPQPVTNLEFVRALGRALRRPAVVPVPTIMLRLLFGEMSQVLTASQRVLPTVAQRSGYVFEFSEIHGALRALLGAQA